MKPSLRPPSKPSRLSDSLDQRLQQYALAASIAGVGAFVLTSPAEGKVVYTPANLPIVPSSKLNLDLNHDGITDFQFSNFFLRCSSCGHQEDAKVKIFPAGQNNSIWGTGKYASVLRTGASIGANGHFRPGRSVMVASKGSSDCGQESCPIGRSGQWDDITRGYLGFKFVIQGAIHYGWARVNVTNGQVTAYALVTGYAYETVAKKAIVAGDEGSRRKNKRSRGTGQTDFNHVKSGPPHLGLGLLASGASGLNVWRWRIPSPANGGGSSADPESAGRKGDSVSGKGLSANRERL
jgi:hypothetical protein